MYVGTNGIKLWCEKRGFGRPLLLLHGNGEDHRIFDSLATALEDDFTIYAPDSRCHGKSTDTPEISYNDMAEDIAGLIVGLGIEKPLVLGFSDGGIVGIILAIKHPDLIGGLIACGANTKPCGLNAHYRIRSEIEFFFTRSKLLRLMITEPDISISALMRIKTPTAIVAGSNDLVRENETKKLAAAIRGAELFILEGETHDSYVCGCARLAPIVRSFASKNCLK